MTRNTMYANIAINSFAIICFTLVIIVSIKKLKLAVNPYSCCKLNILTEYLLKGMIIQSFFKVFFNICQIMQMAEILTTKLFDLPEEEAKNYNYCKSNETTCITG